MKPPKIYSNKAERNKDIIKSYKAGQGLRQLSQRFVLSQSGIRKVLINAGVFTYNLGAKLNHKKYFDAVRISSSTDTNNGIVKKKRTPKKKVRQVLINARTDKRLNQTQAADILGISREYLSRIENNQAEPSEELWNKIESLYELEPSIDDIRAISVRENKKSVVETNTITISLEKIYYAFVEYTENKRYDGRIISDTREEYAIVCGKWAYISENKRKDIGGKHFHVIKKYRTRPEDMPGDTAAAIFKRLSSVSAKKQRDTSHLHDKPERTKESIPSSSKKHISKDKAEVEKQRAVEKQIDIENAFIDKMRNLYPASYGSKTRDEMLIAYEEHLEELRKRAEEEKYITEQEKSFKNLISEIQKLFFLATNLPDCEQSITVECDEVYEFLKIETYDKNQISILTEFKPLDPYSGRAMETIAERACYIIRKFELDDFKESLVNYIGGS